MSYTQIPATFLTLEVPPTIALTQETSDAVLGYFGLDYGYGFSLTLGETGNIGGLFVMSCCCTVVRRIVLSSCVFSSV